MSIRGWYIEPVSGNPVLSESTSEARSGASCIELSGSMGDTVYLYQEVYLANEIYYFSAYLKSVLAQVGATLSIQIRTYNEDASGKPVPTGGLHANIMLDTNINQGDWQRHEALVDLTSVGPINHCIVVLELVCGTNPIYIDDVMLNRGNTAFPYQSHASDYFYSEDILTEIPSQSYYGSYTISRNQIYLDPDISRYYVRVGVQIDTSTPPAIVTDLIHFQEIDAYTPGETYPVNITDDTNNFVDAADWRTYGDNRRINFEDTFNPTSLTGDNDWPLHIWFKSSATVVLNGSLLAEGSVNADSINVFKLSAITANIGEIYSGVLYSNNYEEQGAIGSKINLDANTLQLGGGGTGTPKLLFDGTNLIFGDGAIQWANLDSTSQTNITADVKFIYSSLASPGDPTGEAWPTIPTDWTTSSTNAIWMAFSTKNGTSYNNYISPVLVQGPEGPPGSGGTEYYINANFSNGVFFLIAPAQDGDIYADYSIGTTVLTITHPGNETINVSSTGLSPNISISGYSGQSITINARLNGTGPNIHTVSGTSATVTVTGSVSGARNYRLQIISEITGTYINSSGIYTGNLTTNHILSGSIALAANSGYIRGGKTTYADSNNAGFYLGYDSTTYKFHIGSSGNYLKWTGTSLLYNGSTFYISSVSMLTHGKALVLPTYAYTNPADLVPDSAQFTNSSESNYYTWNTTRNQWSRILGLGDKGAIDGTEFVIDMIPASTNHGYCRDNLALYYANLNASTYGSQLFSRAGYNLAYFELNGWDANDSFDRWTTTTSGTHISGQGTLTVAGTISTDYVYPILVAIRSSTTGLWYWTWVSSRSSTNTFIVGASNGVPDNFASGSPVHVFSPTSVLKTFRANTAIYGKNNRPYGSTNSSFVSSTDTVGNAGVVGQSDYPQGAGVYGTNANGYGMTAHGYHGQIFLDPISAAPGGRGGAPGTLYSYNTGGTIELWFNKGTVWTRIC